MAAELRRLVGEVLAELRPDLRGAGGRAPAGQAPSWPGVAPAQALAAGGIPSGVPAGPPSAMSTPSGGLMNGPSIPVFPDEWSIHRGSGGRADRTGSAQSASPAGNDSWQVRIETDADLRDFALHVLKIADNPKLRRDLIAGRIRFRLAGGTSRPAAAGVAAPAVHRVDRGAVTERAVAAGAAAPAVHRVDRGAVTERAVAAAAAAGARLVLGPRAVLTPLAKDKARTLGVPIEKER
jgi:hypothetical protein